jgi:hypothetical protein
MLIRATAGVVAGLFALAAAPAGAQDKVERKAAQPEAIKKLEAEIAKLRATEAELHAKLKQLRADVDRADANERFERMQIDRQIEEARMKSEIERQKAKVELERANRIQEERAKIVEDVAKSQRLRDERDKLAHVERDNLARLRDEVSKLAQVDQERLARLQEERARLIQKEIDRVIELKTAGDKPKVVVLGGAEKAPVPYEKMSAEELKQVIAKLQILLEEKVRAEKLRPARVKVQPGAVSQDEILKRIDKLAQEVEELKRAIKK